MSPSRPPNGVKRNGQGLLTIIRYRLRNCSVVSRGIAPDTHVHDGNPQKTKGRRRRGKSITTALSWLGNLVFRLVAESGTFGTSEVQTRVETTFVSPGTYYASRFETLIIKPMFLNFWRRDKEIRGITSAKLKTNRRGWSISPYETSHRTNVYSR